MFLDESEDDARAARAMALLRQSPRGKSLAGRLSGLIGSSNRGGMMAALAQADAMLAQKDFNPQERRDRTGRWTTGGGKFRQVGEVANAITDNMFAWRAISQPTALSAAHDTPPPREEIISNWTRQVRKHLSKDREAIKTVALARQQNAQNARWQAVTRGLPADHVIVTENPIGPHTNIMLDEPDAAARRTAGTTIFPASNVKAVAADFAAHPKTPADHPAATSGYGVAAVLRHEYGHSIDDALGVETRRHVLDAIPDPSTDLTYYAGFRGDQEVIPELLATITEPGYRAQDWPSTVQEAERRLLAAIDQLRGS